CGRPVAASAGTVAGDALTIEERLAGLDVTLGGRRSDGAGAKREDGEAGRGEERDEAGSDGRPAQRLLLDELLPALQIAVADGAVEAERLPEVLAALLDPFHLRDVEEPADADGAVEDEPAELADGAVELALEEAVHHARHERDVVEAVRDHHLHAVGDDRVVR